MFNNIIKKLFKNSNSSKKEINTDGTVFSILNFKCNSCGHKIGQFITNEREIKCPTCGSDDVEYKTLLK